MKFFRPDGPRHFRIDQRHVGWRACRQRARTKFEQLRRLDRVHLDQPREIDFAMLVHEQIEEQTQFSLEPDNPERRHVEFDLLFELGMRRMIRSQN